jgi:hypothetical protein
VLCTLVIGSAIHLLAVLAPSLIRALD